MPYVKTSKKNRPNTLRSTLEALRLTFPVAMAIRDFPDMHYCWYAAHTGKLVLQQKGFHAKVLPCAVIAYGPNWSGSIGHTPETLYAHIDGPKKPLKQWLQEQNISTYPPADNAMHLITEVHHGEKRALLDMSLGQLRHIGYDDAPLTSVWYGDGWPHFESVSGYVIHYDPCPHPIINPIWFDDGNKLNGLVEDVLDLMKLARKANLNPTQFLRLFAKYGAIFPEGGHPDDSLLGTSRKPS